MPKFLGFEAKLVPGHVGTYRCPGDGGGLDLEEALVESEAAPVINEKEQLAPSMGEATECVEEELSSPLEETTSVPEADPTVEVKELPSPSYEEALSVAKKLLPTPAKEEALVESEAAPAFEEKELPAVVKDTVGAA